MSLLVNTCKYDNKKKANWIVLVHGENENVYFFDFVNAEIL